MTDTLHTQTFHLYLIFKIAVSQLQLSHAPYSRPWCANYCDDQLSIVQNYTFIDNSVDHLLIYHTSIFSPALIERYLSALLNKPKIFQSYVPEYPQLVTPRPILSRRLALPVVKDQDHLALQ